MKLRYDIDDDSFSYHTTADSLPWNPLVLTPTQKDVMFQWLEKERYELFKKLVSHLIIEQLDSIRAVKIGRQIITGY